MNATVYYEGWQLDCCGSPYKVGDLVTWTVQKPTPEYNTEFNVDYFEDHHAPAEATLDTLTGRVEKIQIVYHLFRETQPNLLTPVEAKLVEAAEANSFEPKLDDDFKFDGHLVKFSDVEVKSN